MDPLQINVTTNPTIMGSMLNDINLLSRQAIDHLRTLSNSSEHGTHKNLIFTFGLGVTLIYLCCKVYWRITGPSLSRLPRAGKGAGWFGLGLTDAKRDFKTNGRKILDEGYRKV